MKRWAEYDIATVYYSGLTISLLLSTLIILYLRPTKTIKKISKNTIFWNRSFKTTIIISGLFGAMSVSFRSCEGDYIYLLESRYETINKGLEQISTASQLLLIILGIWFIIFAGLLLVNMKKKSSQ